jgi:hypothetical protein
MRDATKDPTKGGIVSQTYLVISAFLLGRNLLLLDFLRDLLAFCSHFVGNYCGVGNSRRVESAGNSMRGAIRALRQPV